MTRDRFPTFDLDQNTTTPAEEAAAARWCHAHGDHDQLVHRMLGLDGAPFSPQRPTPRHRPDRERHDVPADRALLPEGWSRDPATKARVHAQVADLTAQGMTVAEVARRVGLSSRGVQRLRNHQTTSSRSPHTPGDTR